MSSYDASDALDRMLARVNRRIDQRVEEALDRLDPERVVLRYRAAGEAIGEAVAEASRAVAALWAGIVAPFDRAAERATLKARYPEVEPFVESMYDELAANSGKGDQAGWRLMTLRQAWQEISWHTAKLATAIKSNNEPLTRELAADVANGCMMLVDILNHGEVDRCSGCGWVTTIENPACAWHTMREATGQVPAS